MPSNAWHYSPEIHPRGLTMISSGSLGLMGSPKNSLAFERLSVVRPLEFCLSPFSPVTAETAGWVIHEGQRLV